MTSPFVLYASVGLLVGLFATKVLIEPAHADDLMIGAVFGLALGIALALSKRALWGRK